MNNNICEKFPKGCLVKSLEGKSPFYNEETLSEVVGYSYFPDGWYLILETDFGSVCSFHSRRFERV